MGDPNWQFPERPGSPIAITTYVAPTGEVTTMMKSPRRGETVPEHQIIHNHGNQGNVAGDLKVLAELLNAGQLSQEEYDKCKTAVIGKLGSRSEEPIPSPARIETPAPLPVEDKSNAPETVQDEGANTNEERATEVLPIPDPIPPVSAAAASLQANEYEVSEASPTGTVTGFTLLMCAEVYGKKTNLELDFDMKPTMQGVKMKAEEVFGNEAAAVKQPEHPYLDMTFIRLQVYNDTAGTWCDLITSDQLKDFAQMYGFLAPSIWQHPGPAPSPQAIPPPTAAREPPKQPALKQDSLRQYRVHYRGGTVPLRDRPSELTACIMWVPDGTVVSELAPSDGIWRYVEVDGRTGYIDKKYLTYNSVMPEYHERPPLAPHVPEPVPEHNVPQLRAAPIPVSASAHLYGNVATFSAMVEPDSTLEQLGKQLEQLLIEEAKRHIPHPVMDDVWRQSVKTKLLQIHDPGIPGWVDMYSMRQLTENCNLFVQLTTARDKPNAGDRVMLAPGHAPELLTTGCLKQGEMGIITQPPSATSDHTEEAILPITVKGPRGDSFIYFKDDLMLLHSSVVYESATPATYENCDPARAGEATYDELMGLKAIAVSNEDFEEAKRLKDAIDALLSRQQENARRQETLQEIDLLTKLKEEAALREDYAEAKRLKEEIDALKANAMQVVVVDDLTLVQRFRKGMSHVHASKGLMEVAEALYESDPESLYTVIAEFQPTLSKGKIVKNWKKIVSIYLSHAEKANRGIVREGSPALTAGDDTLIAYSELSNQIKGVINFLDNPLSPRTLRDVRHLRKTGSPQRGGSMPQES